MSKGSMEPGSEPLVQIGGAAASADGAASDCHEEWKKGAVESPALDLASVRERLRMPRGRSSGAVSKSSRPRRSSKTCCTASSAPRGGMARGRRR